MNLDAGAECCWFTATKVDQPNTTTAHDASEIGVSEIWESFLLVPRADLDTEEWHGMEFAPGGDVECDDCRDDDLDEANGDAYTMMAHSGMSARDAVDNIRVRWNLTDDEAELICDRLCGC